MAWSIARLCRAVPPVAAMSTGRVANRDILTGSVAAALANVVTTAANVLAFGSLYGGRSVGRNPLAVIVAAFAAPLAAMVIRMAISRTREYDADADGALLTQDPLGLASALLKLEAAAQQLPMRPMRPTRRLEPVSHLMIANPFGPLAGGQLFASHPPSSSGSSACTGWPSTSGRYRRPDRDPGARFATRVVSVVGWSADTSVQASDTEGNHP